MKLVFIRHAEPDYSVDSLTKKGFREAELLGIRTANWKVDQFYCSPYGRAQDTARPTLEARGIPLTSHYPEFPEDHIVTPDSSKAIVYPWLREIEAPVDSSTHPDNKGIIWDLTPQYLNKYPQLFDTEGWRTVPFVANSDYENQYNWVSYPLR